MNYRKVLPLLLLLTAACLVTLNSMLPAQAANGITVKIIDEKGRPVKDAIVQLAAITTPDNQTTSATILIDKTDEKGEISVRFKGGLKKIVEKWVEHVQGRARASTAIFVSVIYENEKGLYVEEGHTLSYDPIEMRDGKHYYKIIRIDLSGEPFVNRTELQSRIGNDTRTVRALDSGPNTYYYAWKLEECKTYPQSGLGEIPVAWADAREHLELEWGHLAVHFGGEAWYRISAGFHAGIALVKGFSAGGSFTFKLGESTITSFEMYFGDSVDVEFGKFSWIYVRGQAVYEAWQLYRVSVSGNLPDVPLDEWKFQVYMRDLDIDSSGEVRGGRHISDSPPSSISYIYGNGEGIVYDYYDIYTGGTDHKVTFRSIRQAYVTVSSVPIELGFSLGVVLASTISPSILPLNILAGLGVSVVAEGSAESGGWIIFEAPSGCRTELYVGVTEFVYEYRSGAATYYYHFPVFGLKLTYFLSGGGSGDLRPEPN